LRFIYLNILLFVLLSTNLNAHGDLHKRIQSVTDEIKKKPDSANLYFKRGKLYYQHSNYESSLTDFKFSKELGLESTEQNLYIAKSNYHLENFSVCKKTIKKILKENPENNNALKLLADIYSKKGKHKKAAELYDKVIDNSEVTYPEDYLYASKAWCATNSKEGQVRSQSILIKGIDKLGDIVVLYNQLISVCIDIEDLESAVTYQKKVIEISNRKERAYLKLAKIQILQKKYNDAQQSIIKAEEHFQKLPHRLRNTKFMKVFYSKLLSTKSSLKNQN